MKKIIAIIITLLVISGGCAYYFFSYAPHQEAVKEFDKAVKTIESKNQTLENAIDEADHLIKSKQKPLEQDTLDNLKTTLKSAKEELREIPKRADQTEDIKQQTKELSKPLDYSATIKVLADHSLAYSNSVKQLEQITNPGQNFIEERLKEIPTITGIQSVTETNDPNGNLNKQGGYTASVYFADNQVSEAVSGTDIVDKGTDGGGNIEVYKTEKEAEARNTYLSAFDGQGILNPGSHYIYGTIIIRTSRHLTATQQNELTQSIYQKLIELR